MVQLRSDAARKVLVACGVPVELFAPADGTGAREAWRGASCTAPCSRFASQVILSWPSRLDTLAPVVVWPPPLIRGHVAARGDLRCGMQHP